MDPRPPDPPARRLAHLVVLLGDGGSWSWVQSGLYCSSRAIVRWKNRFEAGGVEALTGERRGRRSRYGRWLTTWVVTWVTAKVPRDFGFVRSRWTCECLAVLLLEIGSVRVSRQTVPGWLHREDIVWRRPRPVLGPEDPERAAILRRLRLLLRNLPPDEIAVFQDEVEVNSNPKIGSLWMRRGQQAEVETPGNHQKRYLAGSLNWRTGDLMATEGPKAQGGHSVLFIRPLDELRRRLRCYRKIHVICGNASFHASRAVGEYLAEHGDRIVLHSLPKYAPDLNPIERIWWHLHEEITRNHRCQTMDQLLDPVLEWLEHRRPFEVECHAYLRSKAA